MYISANTRLVLFFSCVATLFVVFAITYSVTSNGVAVTPPALSEYNNLPEDHPLWDCRTEGNADCGVGQDSPTIFSSCVMYSDGTGVCTKGNGKRIPIRLRTDNPYAN